MAQTHHWKFNTATQLEDSIGSLDFSPEYGTANSIDGAGVINECVLFEGASGAALSTLTNPFPSSGSFAISFWYKVPSNTASFTILRIGNFYVIAEEYVGPWTPGLKRLRIEDYSSGGGYFIVPFFVRFSDPYFNDTPNNFTYFSISWDGTYWNISSNQTGGIIEFVSGGELFSPTSSIYSNSNQLTLEQFGYGSETRFDDVRVFDSAEDGAFAWNDGFGTEAVYDPNAGNAYGLLPTINISEPSGDAGGGTGSIGGLTTITVTPFSGSALFILDGSASGSLATITVSSFSGIAFPEFIAYGSLSTITVTSFEAIASTITTIQLDYVACDGEVTWTQTLPITGFSSAFQGQDAISSRVTPTIGASGANIVFFEQRTIAASGSYTYDLTALTDFLGGALSLSRAYAVVMVTSSGAATLSPGATNPFQWFFAASTANVTLAQGDAFMFAQPESATIDSGSRTLVVTNTSGSASLTYKIAILGGR